MSELVPLKMVQILKAITIFGLSPSIFGPFLMGPLLVFINELLKNANFEIFMKLPRRNVKIIKLVILYLDFHHENMNLQFKW